MVDDGIDVVCGHALGAQDVGEELTFAGHVGIHIIATGLYKLPFERGVRCYCLWMLTQIIAYQQMISDTQSCVMSEVKVVAGQMCRCIKRLAPGNPQITPMHIPEGDEICDDGRNGVSVVHNDVHVDYRLGGEPRYSGAADVFDSYFVMM